MDEAAYHADPFRLSVTPRGFMRTGSAQVLVIRSKSSRLDLMNLRKYARWYSALSLPVRLLIGAVVSGLGGIGVGIISEYAAYNFALYHDIRPPLEGIPYLRATVSAITFLSLMGAGVIYSAVFLSAKVLVAAMSGQFRMMSNAMTSVKSPFFPASSSFDIEKLRGMSTERTAWAILGASTMSEFFQV